MQKNRVTIIHSSAIFYVELFLSMTLHDYETTAPLTRLADCYCY